MLRIFNKRSKHKLPKTYSNVWYNQSVHMSKEKYPIVFDENGKYIDCKIGLLVVMAELEDGKKAYYEITKTKSRYGDFLYPSDGINCDLKFHSIK